MSENLLELCKRTITKDNVNRIPADWNYEIYHNEEPLCLKRCKEAGFGFFPFLMCLWHRNQDVVEWFIRAWGKHVDWNMSFPFSWLRMLSMTRDACSLQTPLRTSFYYDLELALLLLQSGVPRSAEDGLALKNSASFQLGHGGYEPSLIWKKVALVFFDEGLMNLSGYFPTAWFNDQCREYQTRRAYCRRALIRFGGLLRRCSRAREAGWDRHLVQHMMRYVWATRWREEWNQ